MKASKLNESRLSQASVRRYLNYDERTGELFWKARVDAAAGWNTRWTGKKAGFTDKRGYVNIDIHQVTYLAHRLVWVYVYGEWPEEQVDHIDGNPSNNALVNLRKATVAENQWNSGARKRNKVGVKNIMKRRNSYEVSFLKWRTVIYREYFPSLDLAIAVRNLLAPNVYGNFDRKAQ